MRHGRSAKGCGSRVTMIRCCARVRRVFRDNAAYATCLRQARRRDAVNAPAYTPLLLRPRDAYQCDRSHADVEISGKPKRAKVAPVRLRPSRAMLVQAGAPRPRLRPLTRRRVNPGRPEIGSGHARLPDQEPGARPRSLVAQQNLRDGGVNRPIRQQGSRRVDL